MKTSGGSSNVLATQLDSGQPGYEKNMREMARLVAEIRNQEQQIAEGGGAGPSRPSTTRAG